MLSNFCSEVVYTEDLTSLLPTVLLYNEAVSTADIIYIRINVTCLERPSYYLSK
jgi:hypothetical protein